MNTCKPHINATLMQRRHRVGFTLLEMLLVIIVIAGIITYSATLFKHQMNLDAINKTAGEMTQLLQASQAYYRDSPNSYWPDDIYALERGPYKGLSRCGSLLLSTKESDSYNCGYHNLYTLSFPAGTGSGNPNISAAPKSTSIIITTVAPNLTVAKALAAKLPNGEVNTSTNAVSTFIYTPGYAQLGNLAYHMAKEKIMIVKTIYSDLLGKNDPKLADEMKNKRYLTLNLPTDCPANWTPDYEVALNQFAINKNSSQSAYRGVYICKVPGNTTPQRQLTVKIDRNILSDWYSAGVMIITYCRPPGVNSLSWNGYNKTKQATLVNDASQCSFGPY